MNLTKLASVLLVLSFFVFQTALRAENSRAKIVKVQGDVYVSDGSGDQRKVDSKEFLVNSNETIVTRKDSKAVVQFDDGAMSVLDEKSSLRVEKSGWLSQLGGKVYYVFRKVFGKEKPKKVTTTFSTIGIRGTTFIVDVEAEHQQVALQEGKLNIESPGDDYEFLKPAAVVEDFNAYQQQERETQQKLRNEFMDYKKNISKEFIEYKKSFYLEANKVVSFNGNRVDKSELDKDWKSSFDSFAEFSKDYLGVYKELDESANN